MGIVVAILSSFNFGLSLLEENNVEIKSYDYYEEQAITLDENKIKFSKNITEKKLVRVLLKRNDKLPFAVLSKKESK
jgi:hypothetical protein